MVAGTSLILIRATSTGWLIELYSRRHAIDLCIENATYSHGSYAWA